MSVFFMLTAIFPAKTLDFEAPALTDEFTQTAHLQQSRQLYGILRPLDLLQPCRLKRGKYQIINIFAKKVRGLVSRLIIDHELNEPEPMKSFNIEGYAFDEELSPGNNRAFSRRQ